ncbi:MAG: type II toxin-antitoxin system ParD family antitoxin [Candidatus Helarchaeota archaeon]|nr:type II toxin-antitoxin system ParD family antitoxin [Candidatus Helarchaeota archaeon]
MKTISVNIPVAFVKGLEELVKIGLYANRSEAIRVAIRDLLKKELYNHELSFTSIEEKDEKYTKEQQIITI